MPLIQKTVYFRKEDIPRWEAVRNKAQWLHEHLKIANKINEAEQTIEEPQTTYAYTPKSKPVDSLKLLEPFVPRPPDPKTGYPCCQKTAPCKHWAYDGNESIWVNQLTGAKREAA